LKNNFWIIINNLLFLLKSLKINNMKSLIAKIIKPIVQIYADTLISRLETCDNLFEYEVLISQAVLLDYVCSEEFGFDLN